MDDLSLPEVERLVAAANAVRQCRDASGGEAESDGRRAERRLDALFRAGHRLAAYGTLAPGRPNYHVVALLGASGRKAWSRVSYSRRGGAQPSAIERSAPRPGPAVAVQVLTTPSLETAWPALDRFEGPEYQRILVPVFSTEPGAKYAGERRLYTVANLYAAAEGSPDATRR
jgi:gamma-glutamylcyclotransferase (GGCT)/AIG2-like uncharacterized protein YtfP